jgi:hypothetical protein
MAQHLGSHWRSMLKQLLALTGSPIVNARALRVASTKTQPRLLVWSWEKALMPSMLLVSSRGGFQASLANPGFIARSPKAS